MTRYFETIREKPTCNCGVFGITGDEKAAYKTFLGLHALQHRGQEAAGIITHSFNSKGKSKFNIFKGKGLITEVFNSTQIFDVKLPGNMAIGHNRYSTSGSAAKTKNIQPFAVTYRMGNLSVAHNGNLTNAKKIRERLIEEGAIFQTTSDTEVILHLIARSKLNDQVEQIKEALRQIEGAYSLVLMTDDKIIGARDPHGFRPLAFGKLDGSWIIASETVAFDINKAEYIRDVQPGEIIVIPKSAKTENEIKSFKIFEKEITPKHCIFEFIYFSRPDGKIFGSNVDKIRRKLGKNLAKHHPVKDPDGEKVIVISVPDSSNTAAIGYQNQLEKDNIPSKLEIGLIRSHYIGRTFILPEQMKRELGVRIKFNAVKGVLENRTIVLVDDSIVRGTTAKQLVKIIRESNPKSIHIRISSPPISHPCYYGMDFPSKEELFTNKFDGDLEKMRQYLGVDSLEYLTENELLESMVDHAPDNFCTACFTGKYPVPVNSNFDKNEYDI
jgi:amidophosphoribosyltransferase